MTDKLVNKQRITVHSGGGLHARMATSELAKEVIPEVVVNPETKEHRLALLLDCSGSMCSSVGSDNKSKIQLLQDAVQDFVSKANFVNTSIALESFPEGTRCGLSSDKTILWMFGMGLRAEGGTPLGSSLKFCQDYPITRALIISDGEATDVEDTEESEYKLTLTKWLKDYIEKKIPIDTIHIGDSSNGESLLKKISSSTNGLYIKFTDVTKLSEKLHFLLPETRNLLGLPEYREQLGADEVR